MTWLDRLERRLGWLAVPNLIVFVVAGRGLAYVFAQAAPDVLALLEFSADGVRHGQVWRLVSFALLPAGSGGLWILFNLYFTLLLGRALEDTWGAFKFTVYYGTGVLANGLAALALPGWPASPVFLDLTLFFAVATLFPDLPVLLFFVLAIPIKWLALLDAGFQVVAFAGAGPAVRLAMTASFANYLLFFGPELARLLRETTRPRPRPAPPDLPPVARPVAPVHRCVTCGETERTRPDLEFRYCSCSRCGDGREFCREHLAEHRATASA